MWLEEPHIFFILFFFPLISGVIIQKEENYLRERTFAGKNLCQVINIPNLVIDIDTLKKYGNMDRIGELQVPKPKIIKSLVHTLRQVNMV